MTIQIFFDESTSKSQPCTSGKATRRRSARSTKSSKKLEEVEAQMKGEMHSDQEDNGHEAKSKAGAKKKRC